VFTGYNTTINKTSDMENLFRRHDAYLSTVPMEYIRDYMRQVNWQSRLIV
jgi:glycerol-3-phosphate dehydrogenase